MAGTVRFEMEESSQIAEARRAALKMARGIGFDEVRAGEVAIVVTEACSNILKHAVRGELLLSTTFCCARQQSVMEMLSLDQGPGMANLEKCLTDGYTTGSSPGQGLGAIRRLCDESDFYSLPGHGTAVLARWLEVPRKTVSPAREGETLHLGSVNLSKKGQDVCGDSWGVAQSGEISTILVADGLGHGPEANAASSEAVRMLHTNPDLLPGQLLERSHQALRSSRGAAVAVTRVDHLHRKVTFSGVGNVMAQIYAGGQAVQHLVSVNGTAGHQTQRIREFSYPWPGNGLLIINSDGLATSTSLQTLPGLAFHDPSLIAGVLYRNFSRGQDDVTVVVAKAA